MAIVNIASCPVHGLHGQREECFVCGGPVEQVPMVPAAAVAPLLTALEYLADPQSWGGDPLDQQAWLYGHDTPYELAVTALARVPDAPPTSS